MKIEWKCVGGLVCVLFIYLFGNENKNTFFWWIVCVLCLVCLAIIFFVLFKRETRFLFVNANKNSIRRSVRLWCIGLTVSLIFHSGYIWITLDTTTYSNGKQRIMKHFICLLLPIEIDAQNGVNANNVLYSDRGSKVISHISFTFTVQ